MCVKPSCVCFHICLRAMVPYAPESPGIKGRVGCGKWYTPTNVVTAVSVYRLVSVVSVCATDTQLLKPRAYGPRVLLTVAAQINRLCVGEGRIQMFHFMPASLYRVDCLIQCKNELLFYFSRGPRSRGLGVGDGVIGTKKRKEKISVYVYTKNKNIKLAKLLPFAV